MERRLIPTRVGVTLVQLDTPPLAQALPLLALAACALRDTTEHLLPPTLADVPLALSVPTSLALVIPNVPRALQAILPLAQALPQRALAVYVD